MKPSRCEKCKAYISYYTPSEVTCKSCGFKQAHAHIACYSYPNCEEGGCIKDDPIGHRD